MTVPGKLGCDISSEALGCWVSRSSWVSRADSQKLLATECPNYPGRLHRKCRTMSEKGLVLFSKLVAFPTCYLIVEMQPGAIISRSNGFRTPETKDSPSEVKLDVVRSRSNVRGTLCLAASKWPQSHYQKQLSYNNVARSIQA